MILPEKIQPGDFDYLLPPERIAQYPQANRDESRLLILQDGVIREDLFRQVGRYIPASSLLVFNDTRVIRARLIFSKETGATIEVFCLEPLLPPEPGTALQAKGSVIWKCLVGNVKRWRSGVIRKDLQHGSNAVVLTAEKLEDLGEGCFSIRFSWSPETLSFAEILEHMGRVPLPPYITRAPAELDTDRYQTVYARADGSVAAPTAGLHFTPEILAQLRAANIEFGQVTLHVGLGTFRPVSTPDISAHIMHREKILVPLELIRRLIREPDKKVIAAGTTTVRTLESLYWTGVKILREERMPELSVRQWDPYEKKYAAGIPVAEALEALTDHLAKEGTHEFSGNTELMIVPGYRFRLTGGLITNFHLPQSTLLMLVAALAGKEWKSAYDYALDHGFRFLSYGDACLFFPARK